MSILVDYNKHTNDEISKETKVIVRIYKVIRKSVAVKICYLYDPPLTDWEVELPFCPLPAVECCRETVMEKQDTSCLTEN